MQSCARLNGIWRSLPGLALTVALSSLLSACANDNVVVQAVSLEPIRPALMVAPRTPSCDLPDQESYSAPQVNASRLCWAAAYRNVEAKLTGLQRAVVARERAVAKIVKKQ